MTKTRITALALTLLALCCGDAACMDATDTSFPVQQQAIKIVPGEDGSDGGDYSGKGAKLLAYMHDLGLSLTRVGVCWGDCEKAPGQGYDWSKADEMIGWLTDRGIEPLVVLFGSPDWARRVHPDDEKREKELGVAYVGLQMPRLEFASDLSRWAEAFARRYSGRVKYCEFWNEPDGIAGPVLLRDKNDLIIGGRTGGDPVVYAHLLKALHAGLKKGNPHIKLAAGSLSIYDTHFPEAVYCVAGKESFEAISFHPYSDAGVEVKWLKDLRRLSVRYGHPECEQWITEYSWNPVESRRDLTVSYGCGEAASTVPSDGVTICARYPFVTQLYMHTLNDWGDDPGSPLKNDGFGMVTMGLEKKPKYEEFRSALLWRRETLNRELTVRGPSIVFPGRAFDVQIEPTLAENVGEVRWHIPSGWKAASAGLGSRCTVSVPADAALGETYPISAKNSRGYSFTRYVEVVAPLQLANVVLKQPAGAGPATAEVRVNNIVGAEMEGELRFDLPKGWSLVGPSRVKCDANGSATTAVRFVAGPAVAPGAYGAVVRLHSGGVEWGSYELNLVKEATCVRATSSRAVDGDLSDWRDAKWVIVPGEASVSEFSTAWDKAFFYIAVRVHDDRHVQSKRKTDAWQEDSVQVGIDTLCDAVPGSPCTVDDYEMTFALMPDGPKHLRYSCPPDSYGGDVDGLLFRGAVGEGLTTYEIAIPWRELRPAEGRQNASMGLCVVVNDSDGDTRKTSSWGGGIVKQKLPIMYGRIRLN